MSKTSGASVASARGMPPRLVFSRPGGNIGCVMDMRELWELLMDRKTRRLWQSWEDYMREGVRREEFRDSLSQLLEGEDPEFTQYIRALAEAERR
jgi:hypothetical protein